MVRTLSSLSELRDSQFGRPDPRHGLRLLWWFANECVRINFDGSLDALCDPEKGDFGFRPYYNKDKHLPYIDNFPYYKVGNLNHCGLYLPQYVTINDKGYWGDRNKDRIIVSLGKSQIRGCVLFRDVYITQHADLSQFDKCCTYRLHPKLIENIKNLTLGNFLKQMENNPNPIYFKQQSYRNSQFSSSTQSMNNPIHNPYHVQQRSDTSADQGFLLVLGLLLLLCVVLGIFWMKKGLRF